ncbi:Ubiquitin-like domain-containing CTD phosphatase 1 (Nuclear proteasome inhibitor UBLCP1) [Durusdinium trenchii]|uniref:Ubiquitin-like domain-containing CTD phosphatase 1 (Nuclear proteasome inhibitor UBLCP1) n=1 Tax=Durusdinium trenchii TaxID=1381693 RepID=A0ABP0PWS3_9DINO
MEQLKQRVQEHFHRLVQNGSSPNEAAVQALALAKAEANRPSPYGAVSPSPPAAAPAISFGGREEGLSRFGPLCLGLVGPFRSICVVGQPRPGKRLLVLDIDHTIYDPSEYGGNRGSTVKHPSDEAMITRCRPKLHEFLTEVSEEFDIMVWSASDMLRILTLLQQLGMIGAGSNYNIVAVLDIDSMSELGSEEIEDVDMVLDKRAIMQTVKVPAGAIAGQQIEVRSLVDGKPMIVQVPTGHKPGDDFHVTIPGALSSASEELSIEAAELQKALQMSLGQEVGESGPALSKARRRSKSVKPLSLIWACAEFASLYNESNTVIVDDTVDVCRANPQHSIQCSRYYCRDHATDEELTRLACYLKRMARDSSRFPANHQRWREEVSTNAHS